MNELYKAVKKTRDEEFKEFEVEVSPIYKEGVINRVYPKSCYEKSYDYILYHNIKGVTLVHGYFILYGVVVGHAWVEFDNVVFEGVYQRFYDKELYYRAKKLTKVKEYIGVEATKFLLATRHKGPWEEEAEVYSILKSRGEI